jgi:hypothetical protein
MGTVCSGNSFPVRKSRTTFPVLRVPEKRFLFGIAPKFEILTGLLSALYFLN